MPGADFQSPAAPHGLHADIVPPAPQSTSPPAANVGVLHAGPISGRQPVEPLLLAAVLRLHLLSGFGSVHRLVPGPPTVPAPESLLPQSTSSCQESTPIERARQEYIHEGK